ncbi:MAG: TonB-dependent receptor domain-containing protein [Bacteroidota bacterium]
MLIAFMAIASVVFAQQGTILGTVKHSETQNGLAALSVYLDDTSFGASTRNNGQYTIRNVPKGEYTLVVSGVGFEKIKHDIELAAGETLRKDFELQELVGTLPEVSVMTGGERGLEDIPGSVHYISPRQIQKFSYTDPNRTLREIPGINIVEEDGFGLRPNIGLRGTGTERSSNITVMEDGILMAPAPYSAPAAYHFPTMGRMQAVEVMKGSSQIKYGPYTTGGAINLISTPIPREFSGNVQIFGGNFGNRNLHASVGNVHENVGYVVETFQVQSDGFKELDTGDETGFNKRDFLGKIRVHTNSDAKISQSLEFKAAQTQETSEETYLGLTRQDFEETPFRRYAGSQQDVMNTEHKQFSLTHQVRFSEKIDLQTSAYYTEFDRNWYKLDKVNDDIGERIGITDLLNNPETYSNAFAILKGQTSSDPNALEVKNNNRAYETYGIQTRVNYSLNTGDVDHDFETGIRYHEDEVDRFQWVDDYAMDNGVMKLNTAGVPGTESNRVTRAEAFAAYLQYTLEYDRLTVKPGIRYENVSLERVDYGNEDVDRTGSDTGERSNDIDEFIPGIGVNFKVNPAISIFGGIHKGFAIPGTNEGAEAEKSINYELGTRYKGGEISGQAIFFFNDYSNLLGSDLAAAGGGSTGETFNGGEVQTAGLELQLSYDPLTHQNTAIGLPVTMGYTYTDATFQNEFNSDYGGWGQVSSGDKLPYLASHQLSFGIGLEHYKFNVNLNGKFRDEMRTRAGRGSIPEDERIESMLVFDASATCRIHKHVTLFGNIMNITEAVYAVANRPAGLRPGMKRSFLIGVKSFF